MDLTASEQLKRIEDAIAKIESGAQEYQIGRQRVVRADLALLYNQRRSLAAQAERENGGGFYVATFEGRG